MQLWNLKLTKILLIFCFNKLNILPYIYIYSALFLKYIKNLTWELDVSFLFLKIYKVGILYKYLLKLYYPSVH